MAPSSPKIFILTHEFFPRRGGIATFTEEIARAIVALGHPVEVWAQAVKSTETPGEWPFAIKRLNLRGTHGLRCRWVHARHLVRERRRLRQAVVYLSEPGPMLALMPLLAFRAFRPRRVFLTFHGSEILRFHANPITRFFTRRLIAHAEKVSVLTDYTENLLREHFPEAASKIVRTAGALRSNFAVAATPPRTPLSTDSPRTRRLVVLTVGRLHPRKGQMETLNALKSLPADLRAQIEYRLVGTALRPDYERRLRAAAADAGFPVRFLGNVPDAELKDVYADADIFALTSLEHGRSVEGFGLVYLEASARGLPIVAHRVGGVPEAVEDGVTGLLVPPNDPARLSDTFARLLTDAGLRHRLGAAGPAWARRHTWEQSAQALFGAPADLAAHEPEAGSRERKVDEDSRSSHSLSLAHLSPLPSPRLRIRIVQDVLRSGGTERQTVLLAHAFQAAGHDVAVVTFRPGGVLSPTLRAIPRITLQPIDLGLNWFAPRLLATLRREEPDVVLLMGRMANSRGAALSAGLPDAVVVGTMRTGKKLPPAFRRSLARVAHVVANSAESARVLGSDYGMAPDRVGVIHNALVFPPAAAAPSDREPVRARLGASPASTVMLCVGMFRPEKNQRALIEAAARLPASADWRLWFAGEGPTRDDCTALANRLGIGDRVRFLGFQQDPRPYYHAADLAVLASRAESLSNFLIEAQAHGLPVVAARATGVDECIQEDITGSLVAPDDPEALASALAGWIDSPSRRAEARPRAIAFAGEAFSPESRARDYLELFTRLRATR